MSLTLSQREIDAACELHSITQQDYYLEFSDVVYMLWVASASMVKSYIENQDLVCTSIKIGGVWKFIEDLDENVEISDECISCCYVLVTN